MIRRKNFLLLLIEDNWEWVDYGFCGTNGKKEAILLTIRAELFSNTATEDSS